MLTYYPFVIAVVEMMAAGLVTLAHRSGGPLMDIVVEEESSRNGFLASHDQVLLTFYLEMFIPALSLLNFLLLLSLNYSHPQKE